MRGHIRRWACAFCFVCFLSFLSAAVVMAVPLILQLDFWVSLGEPGSSFLLNEMDGQTREHEMHRHGQVDKRKATDTNIKHMDG